MFRTLTVCCFVAWAVGSIFCIETDIPDYRTGSLTKMEPQAIYSADPQDAWNRIFYLLFTRTVQTRLTDSFPVEGPLERTEVMGDPTLLVTRRTVKRIESGDRAIRTPHGLAACRPM